MSEHTALEQHLADRQRVTSDLRREAAEARRECDRLRAIIRELEARPESRFLPVKGEAA